MSFYIEFGTLLKYHEEKLETDIVIPDEVKIIGDMAFRWRSNLSSVVIPESVTEIGSNAFSSCYNLLCVDIREGVEKIGPSAFDGDVMLERVTLPNTLLFLCESAFRDTSLREIVIPDKVVAIQSWTFSDCVCLAHVTLPKSLVQISDYAFNGCKSLKSIEIPEGTVSIGNYSFCNSGLTRVVFPRSLKTIHLNAFENTKGLITNISIKNWKDKWGISKGRYALNYMNSYVEGDPFLENLKEKNNRGIMECKYDIELDFSPEDDINALRYLIREELLEVEDIEFFSEKMIDDPEIIATLLDYKNTHFSAEYMEKWERDKTYKAFGFMEFTYRDWNMIYKLVKKDGKYGIEKYRGTYDAVTVPGKIDGLPVTNILQGAFCQFSIIQVVLIEEGITKIAESSFSLCPNLTEITLPESLIYIGKGAFASDEKLTNITIPNKVAYIGSRAFKNCISLASVTLPRGITEINPQVFRNTAISEIIIPEGVETIEEYAFSDCNNLSAVTFPKSLKRIERCAFERCSQIKKIVLYREIRYIDETAFEDIQNLVIAAPLDSYAMGFALDMGYEFEELKEEE